MVSEIYSPPRITRAARILTKLGITPGFALDITVEDSDGKPWDFTKQEKEDKATELVVDTELDLVVGSLECKEFSPSQHLHKAKSPTPE